MLVVYFSSATENTHRFVQKLGFPSARIPLRRTEEPLKVNEPYVLVCPTYGGGASISHQNSRPVPSQVIKFLNDCLLYTSPSPRDQRGSRMPSSA